MNKQDFKYFLGFSVDTDGQTLMEYALIMLFVVLVVIVALSAIGQNLLVLLFNAVAQI